MKKRTRELDIPKKVKAAVWERDGERCVLCKDHYAMPNAHYIPRSHGGLGIEENIVTLCDPCHFRYDNTPERPYIREEIKEYLMSYYPEWDENQLYYQK